jgi:hypothetical protein
VAHIEPVFEPAPIVVPEIANSWTQIRCGYFRTRSTASSSSTRCSLGVHTCR